MSWLRKRNESSKYANVEAKGYGNTLFRLTAEEEGRKVTYRNYIPSDLAAECNGFIGKHEKNVSYKTLDDLVDADMKPVCKGETIIIDNQDGEITSITRIDHLYVVKKQKQGTDSVFLMSYWDGGFFSYTKSYSSIPHLKSEYFGKAISQYSATFIKERKRLEPKYYEKKLMQELIGGWS